MTRVLLLLLWCSSGVLAAVALTPRHLGRLAWAPAAAVLGPLWLAVATEQNGSTR